MSKFAEIAKRFNVDPNDDEAVDRFFERDVHKLSAEEREGILAELLEAQGEPDHSAPSALAALPKNVRPLPLSAIQTVSNKGFTRELDIVGIGYRAEVKGREIVFQLGYSHPVRFSIPNEIDIVVDAETNHITVTGLDEPKVKQTAAEIRSLREVDPYKRKGIKYSDEVTRLKTGKAAGK